jgi:2',3'-cyclic-nucleotide 2'-phosphodiesterase/3'-nucleotidase
MKKRILAWFLLLALVLSGCVSVDVNDGSVTTGTVTDGSTTGGTESNGATTNGAVPDDEKKDPCEAHSDANENGLCDQCNQSVMTTFDFYSINDLHGKIVDGDNHIGVDEMTTFLKQRRLADDNVIILSAGDMWQGSSESNLTYGALTTEWMNELGFAAMTLGNHEFDWGEAYIAQNAQLAEFPFLAINIYERGTDTQVDYCQSSVVVEADGLQIGIIGAMGDCYSSIAPEKVEDVYFKTGSELTNLVKQESEKLRSEGVDFVVYLLHDGYGRSSGSSTTVLTESTMKSYYDIALSQGYVDLVFEGHSHQGYLVMDQNGVYHLQNRGDNKGGISHVEIAINTVTADFEVTQKELINSDRYSSMADDPVVQELLQKYEEQVSVGRQVVGQNKHFRNGDFLCQTVAKLYYEAGVKTWGSEYEIVLGGGYLSVRSPYNLPAGDVTYSQLQSLFPFDNDLVLCSIKGRDLLSKFINSNNSNYSVSGNAELMKNIDTNETYYIVVDSYTSSYAPNRLTEVERYEPGVYARDLLADYIGQGGLN